VARGWHSTISNKIGSGGALRGVRMNRTVGGKGPEYRRRIGQQDMKPSWDGVAERPCLPRNQGLSQPQINGEWILRAWHSEILDDIGRTSYTVGNI
jgi:hypothetical protein